MKIKKTELDKKLKDRFPILKHIDDIYYYQDSYGIFYKEKPDIKKEKDYYIGNREKLKSIFIPKNIMHEILGKKTKKVELYSMVEGKKITTFCLSEDKYYEFEE